MGTRQTWFLPDVFITLLRDHHLLFTPAMQRLLETGSDEEVQFTIDDIAERAAASGISLKQCLNEVLGDLARGDTPYGVFKIKRDLVKISR